jgi:PAS domain S-box-containing protein
VLLVCLTVGAVFGHIPPADDLDTTARGIVLNAEQTAWLEAQAPIRVGVTRIPPQIFRHPRTGGLTGLCMDYLHEIEGLLGRPFEVVYFDTWKAMMDAAFAREVDVVFAAQQTPSREAAFLFTRPYLRFANKILMPDAVTGSVSMADLSGQRVAVVCGAAVAEHLTLNYPQIIQVAVDDELEGLIRVSFGQADAMVIEISRASWYIQQNKITNLKIVGDAGYDYRLGFACRSDWPVLREILDAALREIPPDRRQAIQTRWITIRGSTDTVNWPVVYGVLAGILLLLAAVVLWNILLRQRVKSRTQDVQQELAERKRVEGDLIQSRRRLSMLMDNLPGIVFRCLNQPQWPMEFLSRGCQEMTGYAPDEFLSRQVVWNEQIHPDDQTPVWEAIQEAFSKHQSYQIEYRFRTRDGRVKWFWEKGIGVLDDEGNPVAMEGFIADMTALKEAQRELRFTQFAIDHAGEAAFWMDKTGKLTYVNDAACASLGYTRQELLELSIPDIDPNFPMEKWAAHWDESREKGSYRIETQHRAKDGRLIPVEVSVNYVCFEGTEYHCSFTRDISRRKADEAARQKLVEELQSKNEELESIVFIASHDLRSPLVNIRGFTGELEKSLVRLKELLADEPLSEAVRKKLDALLHEDIDESMGFIKAGNHKMDILLNGLLRLSRAGTAQVCPTELDMHHILKGIISNFRYRTRQLDMVITVDAALPACRGDAVLVSQVFTNLIENAIKYRSPDRRAAIHVSGEARNGNIVYCVKDNGIGFAPEHAEKVFEIFHRLNPSGDESGEGLGLTIVRRLLKRQGGRAWIESQTDIGTSVYVQLPRV